MRGKPPPSEAPRAVVSAGPARGYRPAVPAGRAATALHNKRPWPLKKIQAARGPAALTRKGRATQRWSRRCGSDARRRSSFDIRVIVCEELSRSWPARTGPRAARALRVAGYNDASHLSSWPRESRFQTAQRLGCPSFFGTAAPKKLGLFGGHAFDRRFQVTVGHKPDGT